MDVNGTLRTAEVFDFERDSNLSVCVRAFDEAGTYVDKNFSLVLSNIVEDLDGDGIEDHNDTDADGDGVSNLLEYLGRSDPMDLNSTNRRPSDINASTSLTVEENASIAPLLPSLMPPISTQIHPSVMSFPLVCQLLFPQTLA